MRTSARWRAAAVVAAVASLAVAGCGGSSNDTSSGSGNQPTSPPAGAKKGGDLTVIYNGDVDNIDPGITYYQYGFNVAYATQRPLYSYKPRRRDQPGAGPGRGRAGDLAGRQDGDREDPPGVKFSPPVNREVTSKDVRYGLERGFLKTVNGAYVGAYMGDVVGSRPTRTARQEDLRPPDAG